MNDVSHQQKVGIACPHCGSPTRVRSSRSITSTYRQLNIGCLNVACGATFGADLTITHEISPSATPNPALALRRAAPRRRPANDNPAGAQPAPGGQEVPPPANDLEPTPTDASTGI